MKRAQIYLDDDKYEALRAKAFQQRTSISSILRDLVLVHVIGKPKPVRSKGGLDAIIGMVHDSKRDVARRHDDYLWGDAS
jgi:hypothetical protein